MYFAPIRSTCIQHFSQSGSFWLSRCPSHTWAHTKYPSSLCVCTRVYKHTHTHHPNTRKNREIYKTSTLSLPLPKHSLPRQQQALTMKKLKQNPLPIPPHTRMHVTPVIHVHVLERLDSTNKQNAPTQVHMYTHTRVYINVYAYIYMDIHIYIYTHIHTHLYTHTCTHIYIRMHTHTHTQTENLNNNATTCQVIS